VFGTRGGASHKPSPARRLSAMQAAWGQEKQAPTPLRGGQLFGEVGKWKLSAMESIPGIYTGPEDPVKKWGSPGKKTVPIQSQSTKRPPEMDIAPAGVKSTIGSRPNIMTMADHDHGLAWPPTTPQHKSQVPFMAMVPEKKPDYHTEVNGIMIGYQGHVPRARDKVGRNPLGSVPGRPAAPNLAVNDPKGLKQTTKALRGTDEPALYISEAHDPQGKRAFAKPRNPHSQLGVMPGYAGHVHRARYTVGLSNHETEDTAMKQYEYMDWESDEWGDGDLSDQDVALMNAGYSAPGGNNEDAAQGYWATRAAEGLHYQDDQAGSGGDDQDWAAWQRSKLGL